MIVLDENFTESQCQLLRGWRMRPRQIGRDLGRAGMKDEEIPVLLRSLDAPTFFTRDLGSFRRDACHSRYCIVCLEVGEGEAALFVRKVLRHPALNSSARRQGMIVRASHVGLSLRSLGSEAALPWGQK
jgi:hypothetical protein